MNLAGKMKRMKKMKIKMDGGLYLLTVTVIYAIIGLLNIFVYTWTRTEYIQIVWMLVLSLPLWIKPIAKWCNMQTIWETMK
jgi:hypothetical protein